MNRPHAKTRTSKLITLQVVIWLAASIIIGGCGRKGPPVPPSGNRPPQVRDLAYSMSDSDIKLSWTVPQPTAAAKTAIAGFLIFRYRQPAHERECANCPVIFKQVGEVPVRRADSGRAAAAPVVFAQTLQPGYRYIYMVTAIDDEGIAGRESNRVEFLF